MIGVIGPRDSVALAMDVAAELGLQGSVIARAYDVADEAPALARELDPACNVLLFTGRVPYTLARQAGGLRAVLDFVPHGGIDLYRAFVIILRDHGGRLPPFSLDTIDQATVEETCRDLGLVPPRHVISLDAEPGAPGIRSTADITTFHLEHYQNGDVEICVTCLGSVAAELHGRGIPVVRVAHTRTALRDALTRAELTDRLTRSEANQIAVAVLDVSALRARAATSTPYDARRLDLQIRQDVLDFAERLQGTVTDGADGTFVIHATRAAIERGLARAPAGRPMAMAGLPIRDGIRVGFGAGETAASAEENARRALALSQHPSETYFVLADGRVFRLGAPEAVLRLRETDELTLARARELGLGPLTLSRLVVALRQLDPSAVTARDLARVYGVAPRSALRLLARLQASGLARPLGRQVAPRAGRPQTVYRVDVDRLLSGP